MARLSELSVRGWLCPLLVFVVLGPGCAVDGSTISSDQTDTWISYVLERAFDDTSEPVRGWATCGREPETFGVDCGRRLTLEPESEYVGSKLRDDLVRQACRRLAEREEPIFAALETGPVRGAPDEVLGLTYEDRTGRAEFRAYRVRRGGDGSRVFELVAVRELEPWLFAEAWVEPAPFEGLPTRSDLEARPLAN